MWLHGKVVVCACVAMLLLYANAMFLVIGLLHIMEVVVYAVGGLVLPISSTA